LQQAIGGVEGEIRVCLQYFFQAWGARGPAKYRDILLNTATEEISHIEMWRRRWPLIWKRRRRPCRRARFAAESIGRTLAVRLYNATADEGMQKMLSYLIARDTMHQQQWLAIIEEQGGTEALPIPNSFDRSKEAQDLKARAWTSRALSASTLSSRSARNRRWGRPVLLRRHRPSRCPSRQ
jgi:Mn-containing catalase